MRSNVSKFRSGWVVIALTVAICVLAIAPSAAVATDRFPDVVLKTHEGQNVRFHEDLLKDKIVLINFFYVTCEER